jgi:hypothetical protein
VRLHPITWLMLFSVAIRLWAVSAAGPHYVFAYEKAVAHGIGGDAVTWWRPPELIASFERLLTNPFQGLGYAAFVEVAWRTWKQLRDERLAREAVA